MDSSSEHGRCPSGSVKSREFADWWSNHQLLQKSSPPRWLFVSGDIKLKSSKSVQSSCYQFDADQSVCNELCPVSCKERVQP